MGVELVRRVDVHTSQRDSRWWHLVMEMARTRPRHRANDPCIAP